MLRPKQTKINQYFGRYHIIGRYNTGINHIETRLTRPKRSETLICQILYETKQTKTKKQFLADIFIGVSSPKYFRLALAHTPILSSEKESSMVANY